jgi:hypothetical protein
MSSDGWTFSSTMPHSRSMSRNSRI